MTRQIITTENAFWQECAPVDAEADTELVISREMGQTVRGFGGCFNEIGGAVLQKLSEEKQQEVMRLLYGQEGCGFTMGRLPVGASDYALSWYSYDETDGDYDLNDFSIERDRKYLLPYLKSALALCPDMRLFASPWSPPAWMKTKKAYNFGRLCDDKRTRSAYAQYFLKYLAAYREEGVKIEQLHVQNEPVADQKFPSCVWDPALMRDFIKEDLSPAFREAGDSTELWFGTINEGSFDRYVNVVLADNDARACLKGAGFQWAGKYAIGRTHQAYPELRLMQTENECGDGENSYAYAEYVASLIFHYLQNGAEAYVYWNMVLPEGGESTWGWRQNAMITVLPEEDDYRLNPEFYIMRHFSAFIKPDAAILRASGGLSPNSVCAKNPDGTVTAVIANTLDIARVARLTYAAQSVTVELPPHAVATVQFEADK